MAEAVEERTGEWQAGWKIVLAAFLGVSITAVGSRVLGVMMKPMSEGFGWTRAQIPVAPLLMSTATLVMSPLMGSLADRFGRGGWC